MSKKDEALKLALEALERGETELRWRAITAIKEALTEQQERNCKNCCTKKACSAKGKDFPVCSFYVPPAQPAQQQPIGVVSRARIALGSGAGYKEVAFRFNELYDAEQIRLWALSCGALAEQPAQQEPVAIEHCLWARNGNTPCPHTTPPASKPLTDEGQIE